MIGPLLKKHFTLLSLDDRVKASCAIMNISDPTPATNPARISEFEVRHDLKLPDDYRAFLLGQNGGYPYPKSYAADSGVEICVSRLLSLDADAYYNDLDKTRDAACWTGKDEHGIIQIAYDVGGQIILLATKGSLAGTVYLIIEEQAYLVAESFTDFLTKLDSRYGFDPSSEDELMMDRIFGNQGEPLKS
jgi:hypothetical protein